MMPLAVGRFPIPLLLLLLLLLFCGATPAWGKAEDGNRFSCSLPDEGRTEADDPNKCTVRFKDLNAKTEYSPGKPSQPHRLRVAYYPAKVGTGGDYCVVHVKLSFVYIAYHNETTRPTSGFGIEASGGLGSFVVTPPKNYDPTKKAIFSVDLKAMTLDTLFMGTYYNFHVYTLPKSEKSTKRTQRNEKVFDCLTDEELKSRGKSCKSLSCESINQYDYGIYTESGETAKVEPTPLAQVSPARLPVPVVLVIVAFLLIVAAVVLLITARDKIRLLDGMTRRRREKSSDAVVLVSSGDTSSRYVQLAARIASALESSSRSSSVYLSDGGELEERLREAGIVVLVCSPHGRVSYDNFVARGAMSTWKDEFVVGARRLVSSGSRRAVSVYEDAAHVPDDFRRLGAAFHVTDDALRRTLNIKSWIAPGAGGETNRGADVTPSCPA